jgi:RNA polymerase sigma factor (sigma-70 family)
VYSFKEHEVWSNFLKGDQKEFGQLYNYYYQALTSYGQRFHHDLNFTEEAIQDLFVKLWQSRENLSMPKSVKHYLFKSLRNIIYNKLAVVRHEVYVGSDSDIVPFEFNVQPEHPDHSRLLIKKLMSELTERQKEAVYLFYQEDLSYQEVADILKIKVGGTYKLLYRAVDKMREQMNNTNVEINIISTAKA